MGWRHCERFLQVYHGKSGSFLYASSKISFSGRGAAGHHQRCQSAVCHAPGPGEYFQAERLRRTRRNHPPVFHSGAGTETAASQQAMRHKDIPGTGIQRPHYPEEAGSWQTGVDHAQLPCRRKTHCERGTAISRGGIMYRLRRID